MEDERDKVVRLENEVTTLQTRDAETQNMLNQILDTVARLAEEIAKNSDPLRSDPLDVPMPPDLPPRTRKVKPASPPEFDGERTKGLAILNSCQTY
jgi:hypothetical protein